MEHYAHYDPKKTTDPSQDEALREVEANDL